MGSAEWSDHAKRELLRAMKPVGCCFAEAFLFEIAEAKAKARERYRLLREESRRAGYGAITADGRQIQFSRAGFGEATHHAADRRVLAVLACLKPLVEKSIWLFSEKPEVPRQQVTAFHYYAVKADFGDEGEAIVLLEFIEQTNGIFFYDTDANSLEKMEAAMSAPLACRPEAGAGGLHAAFKGRLAKWWVSVKPEGNSC